MLFGKNTSVLVPNVASNIYELSIILVTVHQDSIANNARSICIEPRSDYKGATNAMTDEKRRKVHVWVDPWMWREFYRLFPSHGARSAFIREAISRAIELGPESTVAKRIMERLNKDETIE